MLFRAFLGGVKNTTPEIPELREGRRRFSVTTTVIVDTCGNVKRETVIDTRGTYEGSLDQEFLAGGKEDLSRGAQRSSSRR